MPVGTSRCTYHVLHLLMAGGGGTATYSLGFGVVWGACVVLVRAVGQVRGLSGGPDGAVRCAQEGFGGVVMG